MLNCVRVRISSGAPLNALVVKLVDTLSSGGSAFGVWVRIPSRAPDADMVQMVEQRSPKPLMWVQLLLSVPWSHSSVGRAKDWNFLWRWFNSSWDHHFLTINCLCGDFRHATVFLIFKDKTIQPARLSFQAKVQYRKHEPVHHKKQGTEVHCIPLEVPKLELYSSNVTL